jgi:L-histidine N-alpha-methyltransferase
VTNVRVHRRPTTPAAAVVEAQREFAADVARDLALHPKRLQPKYLYDALGSQLFEAICELPWYAITRAERRLLVAHAAAMTEPLPDLTTLIELGCGSGEKIGLIAAALRRRGGPIRVHLVDISPTALELSARTLAALPHVGVVTHRATYDLGLRQATASTLRHGSTLALFLGSNIGNFHPAEAGAFLGRVRRALRPGDGLLVGADLVKPEPVLLCAYDDPLGVTAAFDKNLLVRINRELGGTFDLADFAHQARWRPTESRIEMHLVARRAHRVAIAGADLDVAFAAEETIWTESSYKYVPETLAALGAGAGFRCARQWVDAEDGFAATLFLV